MCLQYASHLVCGGVAMKVGDIVSFSKGNPGRKGKIVRIFDSISEVEVECLTSGISYFCRKSLILELNKPL